MRDEKLEIQLEQILRDLELQQVHRSGSFDFSCSCPFHEDRNPSFSVSFHPQRWGLFFCFSCGEGGNFTTLVEKIKGDASTLFQKPSLVNVLKACLEREEETLIGLPVPTIAGEDQAVQYLLNERGYSEEEAQELTTLYGLFRGSGNWHRYIILPVRSAGGEPLGFTSRNLTSKGPKTKHPGSSDKKDWLFGLDICLNQHGSDFTILTEGPFDTLRLYSYGYPSIALLGPPTKEQLRLLKSLFYSVYTAFDGDAQGKKYQAKVSNSIPAIHLQLPYRKDPDELRSHQWERIWGQRIKHLPLNRLRQRLQTSLSH